jgi:hypothetical protein
MDFRQFFLWLLAGAFALGLMIGSHITERTMTNACQTTIHLR